MDTKNRKIENEYRQKKVGDNPEILLVDADSKEGFPNLALMKLSAYYKMQGFNVDLIKGIPQTAPLNCYDKVFISCIFFQNRERVLDYAAQFDNAVVGGSGIDFDLKLDYDIEHILPDYSLYKTDFSMGFTSRGCIRNCGFCIVPQKEGKIRDNAPVIEFWNRQHRKVMLFDNNFLASPRFKENMQFLINQDLKVNFNQGLDIRLVDAEKAELLHQVHYYSWSFKTRGLHFAFDDLRYEKQVRRGINHLLDTGISKQHLMFYVLVGYNTTFEQDLQRVEILRDIGVKPYIMRFNQCREPELNRLARWINRKYYEFIPFESFQN